MAAPILWAPGKCVLSAGKSHVHKIPRFRGGGIVGCFLGGSADFIFMGARIFLTCDFDRERSHRVMDASC